MCSDLLCVRSHLDKTTTWHDPRVPQLQSAASQHPIANTPVHAHSLSNPAATTQAQNSINPEPGIILSSPTIHPPTQNPPPPGLRDQPLLKAQSCLTEFSHIHYNRTRCVYLGCLFYCTSTALLGVIILAYLQSPVMKMTLGTFDRRLTLHVELKIVCKAVRRICCRCCY